MSDTAYAELGPTPSALPATQNQLNYAKSLAEKLGVVLPWDVQQDRRALSAWIDEQRGRIRDIMSHRTSAYPTSKQVAFAERIARIKRTQVPPHCFKDKHSMSRWIDDMRPR